MHKAERLHVQKVLDDARCTGGNVIRAAVELAQAGIPLRRKHRQPLLTRGDAQPAETMTAEAAAEDGEELAMVPVPGLRPQVELDQSQTCLLYTSRCV